MHIPYFNPWMIANPTLPKMYWEVKSQEQLIANLYCILNALKDTLNDDIEQTNENTGAIEQIQKVIDSIENGEYLDQYIDGLGEYIDKNLIAFVGQIAQYIFPSLYWDGTCYRYCIDIPTSWEYLKFKFYWDEDDMTWHVSLMFGDGVITEAQPDLESEIADLNRKLASVKKNLDYNSDSLQTSVNEIIGFEALEA